MKNKFHPLIQTGILVIALACSGCVLIHHHSAYRSIHADARAGDVAQVAADLSQNPGDVNLPDDAGLTPLHLAASYCRTNVVMLLLDKGAKVNQKAKDGATPLHLAAQEGCANTVLILLSKGANVNARDDQGRTPLRRAEQWNQDNVAQLLRQHGGKD